MKFNKNNIAIEKTDACYKYLTSNEISKKELLNKIDLLNSNQNDIALSCDIAQLMIFQARFDMPSWEGYKEYQVRLDNIKKAIPDIQNNTNLFKGLFGKKDLQSFSYSSNAPISSLLRALNSLENAIEQKPRPKTKEDDKETVNWTKTAKNISLFSNKSTNFKVAYDNQLFVITGSHSSLDDIQQALDAKGKKSILKSKTLIVDAVPNDFKDLSINHIKDLLPLIEEAYRDNKESEDACIVS